MLLDMLGKMPERLWLRILRLLKVAEQDIRDLFDDWDPAGTG